MIRWRFLLTRLIVLSTLLMLVRWGLAPVARQATIWSMQKAVGARVQIDQASIGFFPPRVQYRGLRVADPRSRKAMYDAVSAEAIDITIDGDALLRRRFVAREGRITGLRIGGDRTESGHLPPAEESTQPTGPSFLGGMLKGFGDQASDQARQIAQDLETVRRADAIRRRWEGEYGSLSARAKRLETDVRQIRDTARSIDNPLRDLPRLQETVKRAEAVRNELLDIRRKIDSLPGQAHADLAALEEARQIDLQRVQRYLPVDLRDPDQIGPELLTAMVRGHIDRVRGYLDSGRQIADWTVAAPTADRGRGEDILLTGPRIPPNLLVRRCEISGHLSVDQQAYTMTGILENVTPQTDRLTDPLRARLRLEGPRVVRVDYRRFYDAAVPRDSLVVHWPQLKMPRKHIGSADDGGLAIDGGQLELWVQVEMLGPQLSGRMVSRQTDTQLSLQLPPKLQRTALASSLQKSLSEIDRIEVDARFAGTWTEMDLTLASNLTEALSQSVRRAAADQLAQTRQQLTETVDASYRQQMQKLQDWLGTQQSAARDLMAQADQAVEDVHRRLVSELPQPSLYMGRLNGALQRLK